IITMGPYPKDIPFEVWNPVAWEHVPETGKYMHWETVNPEWWVPQGYVVIRCDSRGTGKSPGRARLLSLAEAEDFYDAVEWAGTPAPPWPGGGRGLLRRRRVGRSAALEQRQGRRDGHLVLRDHGVARGGVAAATPSGDRAVGRRGRSLSGCEPSRRDLLGRLHPRPGQPSARGLARRGGRPGGRNSPRGNPPATPAPPGPSPPV